MTGVPEIRNRTTTQLSDEQLVSLCQRQWPDWGDAFAALIGRYEQPVYGACLRYLRHETDAGDAAQAVFIRVWRHLVRFEGRSSFRTWLYRIVHNQCHTASTSAARRPPTESIDQWEELLAAPEIDDQEKSEIATEFKALMTQLSSADREVLERRFYREQTLEQLAKGLGISLSAAKMRLYRALDRFKHIYTGQAGAVCL